MHPASQAYHGQGDELWIGDLAASAAAIGQQSGWLEHSESMPALIQADAGDKRGTQDVMMPEPEEDKTMISGPSTTLETNPPQYNLLRPSGKEVDAVGIEKAPQAASVMIDKERNGSLVAAASAGEEQTCHPGHVQQTPSCLEPNAPDKACKQDAVALILEGDALGTSYVTLDESATPQEEPAPPNPSKEEDSAEAFKTEAVPHLAPALATDQTNWLVQPVAASQPDAPLQAEAQESYSPKMEEGGHVPSCTTPGVKTELPVLIEPPHDAGLAETSNREDAIMATETDHQALEGEPDAKIMESYPIEETPAPITEVVKADKDVKEAGLVAEGAKPSRKAKLKKARKPKGSPAEAPKIDSTGQKLLDAWEYFLEHTEERLRFYE